MRARRLVTELGFVALATWLAAAPACSSTVVANGTGGTGGSGTTTTTTTTSGTGASGTGGGSTGGAGGASLSCEPYLSDPNLGPAVTIHVVNAGASDVFLGDPSATCDTPLLYALYQSGGDPPAVYTGALGACDRTCAELQTQGCECAAGCAMPYAVRITPGGSYDTTWGGHVFNTDDMPAACYADPNCKTPGSYCPIARQAPASLRVSVLGYASVDCGGAPCTCVPNASGSCTVPNGSLAFPSPSTSSDVIWQAGQTNVSVTFN